MKTFVQTKEQALADRAWHVVDAQGKPLGRLASEVAALIRGKHKPAFSPHLDCGDFVIVLNASQIKLSGSKLTDKIYYRHTGYIGGIKGIAACDLLQKHPDRVIELAVKRMLPKGALGHQMIKKLKVYADENHPHSAQSPKEYKLQYVN